MADRGVPLDPGAFLREHVAERLQRRIAELRVQTTHLERELADSLAAEATLAFVLEGEGGGSWYVNVDGENIRVDRAAARPPLVRLSQSRADWEALVRAGLGMGAPPGTADLTAGRIKRLATLKGTLEFRVTEPDGGERRVTVTFGADEVTAPRCAITMRAEDAERLRSGQLTPQAAFMQGLTRLEGDVALAMQVGAALFF